MEDLLKKLFDEKTVKILHELHDKKTIQVRETSRATNIPPATVFRIFKKLQDINLISKESTGSFHIYKINKNTPAYFLLEKLIPRTKPLEAFINSIPKQDIENISLLDESDDRASVLIVGDIKHSIPQSIVEKTKKEHNYSIKTLILSKAQYENLSSLNMKPNAKKVLFKKKGATV